MENKLCDVLVVIDMQNDFIDGSLGSVEAKAIVPNVRAKIEKYMEAKKPILFTQDTHFDGYLSTFEGKHLPVEHCLADTHGWEISSDVISEKEINYIVYYVTDETDGIFHRDDFVFEKNTFGTLEVAQRISLMGGFDYHWYDTSIEICGLCTDICVVSNALILREQFPDAMIVCDASCCAGTTPEKHRCALEVMKSCQIDVVNE